MASKFHERNFARLREVVAFLAERGEPTPQALVLTHVAKKIPPVEDDALDLVGTGRQRWRNDLLWQTTEPTKAGWMVKDRRGVWAITDAGREALKLYPDFASFRAEAHKIYREWQGAKQLQQRRAWLVRGSSVLGANIVSLWLDDGYVSLPASQLREIEHGVTAEDLAAIAQSDYDHLKHQELKSKVYEIVAFVTRMAIGDLVMTTSEQQIYIGDVTGDWTWQVSEGGRSNLRRTVEWRNPDNPLDFTALPSPLAAKLASGSAIVDLSSDLDLVDELTAIAADELVDEVPVEADQFDPSPRLARHEHLRAPSAELASELFVDSDWLVEVEELLDERRQLIFYGPPGTGKTYIARKLAADLVGPEQVKLVQFHPAYTYEDFFEGYRPTPSSGAGTSGTIGFELRAGPLRQLVTRAREHPDQAFVLIVDEINRGNLAKVFGELYFLLEYRDEAIDLLYSSDDEAGFTLPPNLYLIGTMNTADRSIALVDSALRRRFAFVGLDPGTEPTRSLLARWSKHHGLSTLGAELLSELNRRLDDPEFRIGPSYFMTRSEPDAFSWPRLDRIWRTAILPLLEEHFYGEWSLVSRRYELDTLLKSLPAEVPLSSETAESDIATEFADDEDSSQDPEVVMQ